MKLNGSILINFLLFFFLCFLLSNCNLVVTSGSSSSSTEKAQSFKIISNRRLEWSDFLGKADNKASWAAAIYWKVFYTTDSSYTYSLPGEEGEGYVEPNLKVWYAIGDRSWVKPRYKNDKILNHEQGHLNIAQLCALEFSKTVLLMKPIKRFGWKSKLDSTYISILGKCRQIQNMYDVETNHGMNNSKQEIWDNKINELIRKLK